MNNKLINYYIHHIEQVLDNVEEYIGNETEILPKGIIELQGMTSTRTRLFYNLLLKINRPIVYLEIGSWKGSSIISAMYNNPHVKGICIDNWCEFGGPKTEFLNNIYKHIPNSDLSIIEKDCFNVFLEDNIIDIYLYDGEHSYENQKKGIIHFWNALKNISIIIIDDWNEKDTQKGTFDGFNELNANIIWKKEIFSRFNCDIEGYWNGMAIFIISK